MSKKLSVLLLALFVFFSLPKPASAVSFRSGDSVSVGKDETLSGTLYTTGATVTIDGVIDGDVFCAGQHVVINGTVNGDVYCAGQSVTVRGDVVGNVRAAGQMVTLDGIVDRNASLLGQTVSVSQSSVVNGEVALGAQSAFLEGNIGREVYGGAEKMMIDGTVGGDVTVSVDSLSVGQNATIAGNVTYTSQHDISISGDVVQGTVVKKLPPVEQINRNRPTKIGRSAGQSYTNGLIKSIVLYLLVGALLLVLFPTLYKKHLDIVGQNIPMTMLTGFLVTIIVPMLLIICAITIIGIPVTILGFMVFGVAYILGRLLVFIFIGTYLFKRFPHYKKESKWLMLITGVVVSLVLLHIPFIGWMASIFVTFWGFGVLYTLYTHRQKKAA